jgi:hypothetical protein
LSRWTPILISIFVHTSTPQPAQRRSDRASFRHSLESLRLCPIYPR